MASQKSIHVVFNPISGQGDAGRELEILETSLADAGNLAIHLTSPDVPATELAKKAVEDGADIVVASGGDGTVSAVATALIGTQIPMGIVPRGTVNAFAGAMNIPEAIADACEIIVQQHVKAVDTARCNGRTMLLLASIGFEANLMKQTDRETKDRYGRFAIFINGIRQWLQLDNFNIKVEASDQQMEMEAAAVTVANAATLQTVLAQGPADIDVNDGNLDLTVITSKDRIGALTGAANLFLSGLLNKQANHGDIIHHQSDSITVTADPEQDIVLDGELIGKTPVTIECFKDSLNVIVPAEED